MHSIQEKLKKINSSISWLDITSLAICVLFIGVFSMYLEQIQEVSEVRYIQTP
jgi:NhaP-type Na+/H+ or K+/H+ antiporter